jgi:hypothetical protein
MKVDFNNLRKQALYSYNKLCVLLNNSIQDKSHDPVITIDPDEIQEEMDELRLLLFSIAYSYCEGDEDFKNLGDSVGVIASFNETENDFPPTTSKP